MDRIIFDVIDKIIANFDFVYMLSINILTYAIIKTVDELNGKLELSKSFKQIVLIGSTIVLFIINSIFSDVEYMTLINSSIAAPFSWSFIFKPIFAKLKLDYTKSK